MHNTTERLKKKRSRDPIYAYMYQIYIQIFKLGKTLVCHMFTLIIMTINHKCMHEHKYLLPAAGHDLIDDIRAVGGARQPIAPGDLHVHAAVGPLGVWLCSVCEDLMQHLYRCVRQWEREKEERNVAE